MTTYPLYLESGPRRKKTMVHVLDLLGCIANGPTTEIALERTPGAIRAFLRFLQAHGEGVDPEGEIEVFVVQHVTEGIWLGNGDPSIGLGPDLTPLSEHELETFIRRLEWMREELNSLLGGLTDVQLEAEPEKGRSLEKIVEHLIESEYAYMYAFGRIDGLPALSSILKKREGTLLEWYGTVRKYEIGVLRGLTEEQRTKPFVHWKYTRTARKVLRRMLEHQWEHLVEMGGRGGK